MPRKTIFTSSLSGTEMSKDDAVIVRIKIGEVVHVADLTKDEATQLVADLKAEARKPKVKTDKAAAGTPKVVVPPAAAKAEEKPKAAKAA